jgi:hypothetical protein
MTVEN